MAESTTAIGTLRFIIEKVCVLYIYEYFSTKTDCSNGLANMPGQHAVALTLQHCGLPLRMSA